MHLYYLLELLYKWAKNVFFQHTSAWALLRVSFHITTISRQQAGSAIVNDTIAKWKPGPCLILLGQNFNACAMSTNAVAEPRTNDFLEADVLIPSEQTDALSCHSLHLHLTSSSCCARCRITEVLEPLIQYVLIMFNLPYMTMTCM